MHDMQNLHPLEPKNDRGDWTEFAQHSADLAAWIRARKSL